jgi:hypothetical protein
MKTKTRAFLLAAALAASAGAAAQTGPAPRPAGPTPGGPVPTVTAPSVRAGLAAWQAGDYALAIGNWRPLADRGDPDAQYDIAQAYFLGRGVPQNSNLAEQWYERAARQGHQDAQANYGLLLFQNGRRREAMPWIEQAANRGDPRAQYVFGTALYNGDLVPADLPRAYAMMSRAAAAGLPPAIGQLQAMEPHLTPEDRARGSQIAQTLPEPPVTEMATAAPPRGPALAPDRPHARPPAAPRPPARPVQTAERPSTALADLADAIPPEGQAPRRPRPQGGRGRAPGRSGPRGGGRGPLADPARRL